MVGIVSTLLAGCGAKPAAGFVIGDVLLEEGFDRGIGWDSGTRDEVSIGVMGSAYRIRTHVNSYVRGFNSTRYEDVVIDVDASQFSAHEPNAFGVICRGALSDETANGYYFLIGGDGSYSIRKGQFGEINALVTWARSDAVREGAALNRIRAVCIHDYLALYVNDQFVADVRDSTFHSGYIGFAAAASAGSTLDVAFDNLVIRAGQLVGER